MEENNHTPLTIKLQKKHTLFQDNNKHSDIIQIELEQWKFTFKGTDHYIFFNTTKRMPISKYALIFQKQKQVNPLQQTIQLIYKQQLRNHAIYPYLLKKKELEVKEEDYAKTEEFLVKNGCGNANCTRLWITENLMNFEQWDIFVQFKLKSPLPEVYGKQILRRMSEELGLSFQQITLILRESPVQQKTKWYKKNMHMTAKHQNPLDLFGINENIIPSFCSAKLLKHFTEPSETSYQQINKNIKQILQQSDILNLVYSLQRIYMGPPPVYLQQMISDLQNKQDLSVDFNICEQIHSENGRFFSYIDSNLQKLKVMLKQQACICQQQCEKIDLPPEQYLQEIFRFLVSLTWKDISIYYRATKDATRQDVKIIDYQLKSLHKIQDNRKKQEAFLKNYLKEKIKSKN